MARKNEAEVLAYLNGLRKQFQIGDGKPLAELPPDMSPSNWWDVVIGCPVAVALERPCLTGTVLLEKRWRRQVVLVRFPDFVTEFQKAHDRRLAEGI